MIRRLDEKDLPLLADVMVSWLKNTDVVFPIDRGGTIAYLTTVLKDPSYAIFGAFDNDLYPEEPEHIVGWILGQITSYTFLCRKVVSELAWYVDPQFRGAGKDLMTELLRWGQSQGAEYAISCILLSAGKDKGERAIKAIEGLGFQEFEKTFYMKI